ncbi:cystathionine beta-lyase [Arboricoccus pini]|uniref:cystathionine beta-lyase n=1 Tax=Arboricoccus pini TaxID=1963835 RepID=UPI001FAF063D|nr:cystathionine beta-lyase [Arboricoccus pini]
MKKRTLTSYSDATAVTVLGRDPDAHFGIVNPPVYRASTILYPTVDALRRHETRGNVQYGRYGTPTNFALEEALTALEEGYSSIAVGSGKTAITATLLALLEPGDHLLVTDSVYGPTRGFADGMLTKFGIAIEYFDPLIGADIEARIRPNTKAIFLESPGSWTFEIQDVPAIVSVAKRHGVVTLIDNTWASPLFFKPLALGVDISIHAATKYIGGHSDLMMGTITMTEAMDHRLRKSIWETTTASSPDDCALALRGLRTLDVRLKQHQQSAIDVAHWLATQPEVAEVIHPALPNHPGHAVWRRDFKGSSGLFGFILKSSSAAALAAMLDELEFFGMGYSWGGYESLLIPVEPAAIRSAVPWTRSGQAMRMHVGLESPTDLIRDLEAGFARFRRALSD